MNGYKTTLFDRDLETSNITKYLGVSSAIIQDDPDIDCFICHTELLVSQCKLGAREVVQNYYHDELAKIREVIYRLKDGGLLYIYFHQTPEGWVSFANVLLPLGYVF